MVVVVVIVVVIGVVGAGRVCDDMISQHAKA